MRITSVELRPEGSTDVIDLSFRDPRSLNPYQVKSIAPLDADEITPQFYGTSGDATKKYYNMALKQREPVILIGLHPRFGAEEDNSYSDLRDRLFRIIASSRTGNVKIVFKDGADSIAMILGTVSKMESSLFTESPEVQITFLCKDPMIKGLTRTQLMPQQKTTANLFLNNTQSTAPSGFRLKATVPAKVDRFVISPPSRESKLDVRPHGGFLPNDVIELSSENRDRYIYMTRAGKRTYLADVIQSGGVWPILFPGDNTYTTNIAFTWTSIDYYKTYWGV